MTRRELIAGVFELNSEAKVMQYEAMLKDIPTNKIITFANYTLANKQEYETRDVMIMRCLKEYQCLLTLDSIRQGDFRFKDMETMINFIKANFKGKDLTYGITYKPYVIIAMDKDGNLVNKYVVNEFGRFNKLDCDDEAWFYKVLFDMQERIGVIKHFTKAEVVEAERGSLLTKNKTTLERIESGEFKDFDTSALEALLERFFKGTRFFKEKKI